MLSTILAIGGGNIKKGKTVAIDKEIVRCANKTHPVLLFIPTASSDNKEYADAVKHYFNDLGCTVDTLWLCKEKPSYQELSAKILGADIIYVGGGNTLKMMRRWRFLGVDKLLRQAHDKGTVLCGVSAGSICWFNAGNSDSRKDNNPAADYIKVTALGFIDALHCPHYDSESERKESVKKMMQQESGVGIALQDCAALQIVGDTYRILTSSPSAKAYKLYWLNGRYYEEVIEQSSEFKPLKKLLAKNS